MILERGDMWSVFGKTDWFLITTNPIVTRAGKVVMGRGIALEAATKFPSLAHDFAEKLSPNSGNVFTIGFYGEVRRPTRIGCFMVKDHWKAPAKLSIIKESCDRLLDILNTLERSSMEPSRVDLNFPGIGNGRLKREDVLPLLEELPDNVHIWTYE